MEASQSAVSEVAGLDVSVEVPSAVELGVGVKVVAVMAGADA